MGFLGKIKKACRVNKNMVRGREAKGKNTYSIGMGWRQRGKSE